MEKKVLDFILVPSGLFVMVAYHCWLLYHVVKHPTKTVIGVNAINRRLWVQAMMEVHNYIYIYILNMFMWVLKSSFLSMFKIAKYMKSQL